VKRYYITDRKAVGGFRPLLDVIRDQMQLGVDFIQIREKDLAARELFNFTLAVLEARAQEVNIHAHPKIFINTRADVAKAAGADGVHLPAAAPTQTLPGLLIGRSCHTIEEVQSTQADLVTFGPVFPSPGKGPATGLDLLSAACRAANKSVFALGGITWENAAACMQAGATGIAGIRLFQQPDLD
jgi:thiamine-phosphate pyrophosphorylase